MPTLRKGAQNTRQLVKPRTDLVTEPAETFSLVLSSPTGYTLLSDTNAVATIANDD